MVLRAIEINFNILMTMVERLNSNTKLIILWRILLA
jgi:hypothetical protein